MSCKSKIKLTNEHLSARDETKSVDKSLRRVEHKSRNQFSRRNPNQDFECWSQQLSKYETAISEPLLAGMDEFGVVQSHNLKKAKFCLDICPKSNLMQNVKSLAKNGSTLQGILLIYGSSFMKIHIEYAKKSFCIWTFWSYKCLRPESEFEQ